MKKIQLSGIFVEGYGIVPKLLMKADDISSNTKLVLCYLLSYTGAGVHSYPNMDQIANDLKISKRTVIRTIREAEKNGYLHINKYHLGQGKGSSNEYVLMFMEHSPITKKSENASAKIAHAKNARAHQSFAGDTNDKKNEFAGDTGKPYNKQVFIMNNIINNINFPFNYNIDLFKTTLEEWIKYKYEIKNRYTETGLKKLINKLIKFDIETVTKAIDNSISNQWKGVFPESIKANNQSKISGNDDLKELYKQYGEKNENISR